MQSNALMRHRSITTISDFFPQYAGKSFLIICPLLVQRFSIFCIYNKRDLPVREGGI